VPVFNSAASLGELCDRVGATLDSTPRLDSWELILVNDGSHDASWEEIVRLAGERAGVRGLDLSGNWGQHNALLAGVHAATGEVIVTLDDDLQNPPEEIVTLLDALSPDLDLVYGVPTPNREPLYRRIGAIGLRTVLRAINRRPDALRGSGFRAFRSTLLERFPDGGGRRVVLDPLLRAASRRVGSVPVRHEPRRVGRSNYSLLTLARLALAEIAVDLSFGAGRTKRGPSYEVRAVTDAAPSGDVR
jgi:glycosyltransferase involved in cell wall biosynthesis